MNEIPRQRIVHAERLRGRDLIHRIFETGLSARRGKVIARFVFAEDRSPRLRVGVATSKRIPTAVARNYRKRLLREAIRHNKPACETSLEARHTSADVMFIWTDPSPSTAENLLAEISTSIRELFDFIAAAAAKA